MSLKRKSPDTEVEFSDIKRVLSISLHCDRKCIKPNQRLSDAARFHILQSLEETAYTIENARKVLTNKANAIRLDPESGFLMVELDGDDDELEQAVEDGLFKVEVKKQTTQVPFSGSREDVVTTLTAKHTIMVINE